jgi:predicted nucleotidyltransferase
MKSTAQDQLLAELKRDLKLIYGSRLCGLYLFGSFARQDQDPESDLDILIVLSNMDRYYSEIKRSSEVTSRLSLKYGVTISRVFMRELDWKMKDSPLLLNIREEVMEL